MKALWSRIAVGLALGLVVVVGTALLADVRAIGQALTAFHWRYLPAVLGLTLVNYGLRFIKWHYYIRLVGARSLNWRRSLQVFVAGFPLALSPGKLAEPIKAVWLNHYTGVPVARGVPVVAAERISDGLALLLLSTLGVLAYPQFWPGFAALLIGLLSIVVLSQVRPVALRLIDYCERLPLLGRFSRHLREFYEGAYQLFSLKSTLVAIGLGFGAWLAQGLGFYLILRGLGQPPALQTASIAVFVLAFSTIVGAVSSLPGGLGAAEASLAGLLTLTLGVPEQVAASATLLIRFFTLWFGVGLGVVTLLTARELVVMEPAPPTPEAIRAAP